MHLTVFTILLLWTFVPVLLLHKEQRRQPRQPQETAWLKSLLPVMLQTLEGKGSESMDGIDEATYRLYEDLEQLGDLLEMASVKLDVSPPVILVTTHTACQRCLKNGSHCSLRRREESSRVKVIQPDLSTSTGVLFVAHCIVCLTNYFPDCYTYANNVRQRTQRLEYNTPYLRISKHGVWAHRDVAFLQEKAVFHFRASWTTFAQWANAKKGIEVLTIRQAQRLYLEHFAR